MISSKKLIRMARKWQKLAAASRRRISWPKSKVADEGHFVVYTTDGKRYMISLEYLKTEIIRELFRTAEEEFGVTSDGPITLPCDSSFMYYAISILQRHVTEDLQKALLLSFDHSCSSSSSYLQQEVHMHQQLLVSSF